MKRVIFAAMLVAGMFMQANVQAGIFGSSFLGISDLKVTIVTGFGSPRPATGTFDTDAAGFDFRIGGSATTATNSATLNATTDIKSGGHFIAGTTAGGIDFGASDAALATVSSATNYFAADSSFGGSALDVSGAFGLAYGGSADTAADFNIDDPGFVGDANGNVTNFASISFSAGADLDAVISFDATSLLTLGYTGIPAGLEGFASNSFGVTLIRTSGAPATILSFTPPPLNTSISITSPGFIASGPFVGTLVTAPISLKAGETYTLTLNQTSTVRVTQVPEPASLLIVGALGCCGTFAAWRKRKR